MMRVHSESVGFYLVTNLKVRYLYHVRLTFFVLAQDYTPRYLTLFC